MKTLLPLTKASAYRLGILFMYCEFIKSDYECMVSAHCSLLIISQLTNGKHNLIACHSNCTYHQRSSNHAFSSGQITQFFLRKIRRILTLDQENANAIFAIFFPFSLNQSLILSHCFINKP